VGGEAAGRSVSAATVVSGVDEAFAAGGAAAGGAVVLGAGGAWATAAGGGALSTAVVGGTAGCAFSASCSGASAGGGFLATRATGFAPVVVVARGAGRGAGPVAAGACAADATVAVGAVTAAGSGGAAVGAGATAAGAGAAAVVVAGVVGGNPGTVITIVPMGDANVIVSGSIVTGDGRVGSGVAPPAVSTSSCESQNPAAAQDTNPAHAMANSRRWTNRISALPSLRNTRGGYPERGDENVCSVVAEDSRYPRCREGVPQTSSPCRRPIHFRIARSRRAVKLPAPFGEGRLAALRPSSR
jgi:hypothetical protein